MSEEQEHYRYGEAGSADLRIGMPVTYVDGNLGEFDRIIEGEIPVGEIVSYGPDIYEDLIMMGDTIKVRIYTDRENYLRTQTNSDTIDALAGTMEEYERHKFETIEEITHPTVFKINKYITLKLKGKKTQIYVDSKQFMQCKYLLLNLEPNKEYKEINSIDDAAKTLSRKMEIDHSIVEPKEEFWGHCSNIQAWAENNYDLRIIHTNLGFPLLKELIKCGDTKAEIALKEEIMFRIEEGGYNAFITLKDSLTIFTIEEIDMIKDKIRENKEFMNDLINEYIKRPFKRSEVRDIHIQPQPIYPRIVGYEMTVNRTTIRGGISEDDHMDAAGDYIATIHNVIRLFIDQHGIDGFEIRIISCQRAYHEAMIGNHFYNTTGMMEYDRIMSIEQVKEWVVSRMLEEQMIFQVYYFQNPRERRVLNRQMVEYCTGRLTFQ